MIPLMGITWLFGLLSPWHKAFAYIFTIFNSTQVSIRSLVVITKSFRLHVHHRQFYSGEILMKCRKSDHVFGNLNVQTTFLH